MLPTLLVDLAIAAPLLVHRIAPPVLPTVVWTTAACKLQGGVAVPPIDVEGVAVFGGLDGLVRGLDPATGATLWNVTACPNCGVQSEPTVISGRVVTFGTNDGNLIAFDKRRNGAKSWTFGTEGAVMGAAVLAKEASQFSLYIGSDGGHMYKLVIDGGRPTAAWKVEVGSAVNAAVLLLPAPVPGEAGSIVFTSSTGEVWKVSERDGSVLWKFNATAHNGTSLNTMLESRPLLYSPAVGIGRPLVIVTGWGSCLVNCSFVKPGDPIGHTVFALDAYKGTAAWAFSTDSPVEVSPLLDGEAVLVASERFVYSLAARDGSKVNWVKEVAGQGEHIEQLVLDPRRGCLYVCTDGGQMFSVSLDTGETRWAWQRPDGESGGTLGIRLISGDPHAYVSSTNGWVAKLLLPAH